MNFNNEIKNINNKKYSNDKVKLNFDDYTNSNLYKLKRENIFIDIIIKFSIKSMFCIIFFLICIYFEDLNLLIFIKLNQFLNEVQKLDKFFYICNKGILLNKKKYKKIDNPKISVISTCHNKEKYILRLIRSIQNQFFDDIEIIIVDDHSLDNTVKLIEKYKNEDERISLIKHKINKGTLISRNDGVMKAKGEFIIIPDGDDIFSFGLFNKLYKVAKEKKIDIIKYNIYYGHKYFVNYAKYFPNIIVNQPKLFELIYYGEDNNKLLDLNLWNKFIKREIYIKALNKINQFYLNENMIYYEDALINYILYKQSKTFLFIELLGYLYLDNPNSMMHSYNSNANRAVKSFFLYLKFIFQYSNLQKEDEIINFILKRVKTELNLNDLYKFITQGFKFYNEVISTYLYSNKLSLENKKEVLAIKEIIRKAENKYS